jgi:tetratricopeptide (TPR) repeat protein
MNLKNWRRSAELFEIAFSKDANILANHYIVAAQVFRNLRQFEKAIDLLTIASNKGAQPTEIHFHCAINYFRLSEYEQAQTHFEISQNKRKQLNLNKEITLEMCIFGIRLYKAIGNHEDKIREFEKEIESIKSLAKIG